MHHTTIQFRVWGGGERDYDQPALADLAALLGYLAEDGGNSPLDVGAPGLAWHSLDVQGCEPDDEDGEGEDDGDGDGGAGSSEEAGTEDADETGGTLGEAGTEDAHENGGESEDGGSEGEESNGGGLGGASARGAELPNTGAGLAIALGGLGLLGLGSAMVALTRASRGRFAVNRS